jgi:hypothetical protein
VGVYLHPAITASASAGLGSEGLRSTSPSLFSLSINCVSNRAFEAAPSEIPALSDIAFDQSVPTSLQSFKATLSGSLELLFL